MYYNVTIEKKRRESRLDAKYYLVVEAFEDNKEDTRQNWELRKSGYYYRLGKAKKEALKHIMGVEKDVKAGMKFGVIFELKGTADEIKKRMEQIDYET